MLPIKRLRAYNDAQPDRAYTSYSNFHVIFTGSGTPAELDTYLSALFKHLRSGYSVSKQVYGENAWVVAASLSAVARLFGDADMGMTSACFHVPDPWDSGKPRAVEMVVRCLPNIPSSLRPCNNGWHVKRVRLNADLYRRHKVRVLGLPSLDPEVLKRFSMCATGRFPYISADFNESRRTWQVVFKYTDIMDATYAHYCNRSFTVDGKTVTSRLES